MIGGLQLGPAGEMTLEETLRRMDTWGDDYGPDQLHQMCRALREAYEIKARATQIWRHLAQSAMKQIATETGTWRDELSRGRKARRKLLWLRRLIDQQGLLPVVHDGQWEILWLQPPRDPPGEVVELLHMSKDMYGESYHAFLAIGRKPLQSLRVVKMVEPE